MADTKAKLEEYRRRKQVEEAKQAKKEAFWSVLTLQPLRQRLARSSNQDQDDLINVVDEHNEPTLDGDVQPDDEKVEWSSIDWAIFAVKFLVWVCLQVVFVKIEFGAVFFLFTCIFLMLKNMGKRKAGEMSAYSVFNPNCEAIDGTLTAQQFEREIRHGPAAAT